MKNVCTLFLFLLIGFGAQAQIAPQEKWLGGGVNFLSAGGSNTLTISPEFRYAHAENRLVGGVLTIASNSAATYFTFGPNYSWIFPIEGNLFWSLTAFTNVSVGDYEDVTLGVYPGLGYRIHDKWFLRLQNAGLSYSTFAEAFSFNASLNGFSVGAFYRIGK